MAQAPAAVQTHEITASDIKDIFHLFDKNGDNYVHVLELGTLLRSLNLNPTLKELEELQEKVDPTGSGQFNLQQLENLIRQRGKDPDTIEDMVEALKVFDTDEDGRITIEEFLYAMVNMGDPMTEDEVRELLDEEAIKCGYLVISEFAKTIMSRI